MDNRLFVFTAPSGSGKTSLTSAIIEQTPNLARAISHTTRKPRKGEIEGVHYYFVDDEGFDKVQVDLFARTKYHGARYGTTTTEVDRLLSHGDVILIMDHEGTLQSKQTYPEATTVFILPENKRVLEERLRGRGDMSEADIENRLESYYDEILDHHKYDYVVVNNDFDETVRAIKEKIIGN